MMTPITQECKIDKGIDASSVLATVERIVLQGTASRPPSRVRSCSGTGRRTPTPG